MYIHICVYIIIIIFVLFNISCKRYAIICSNTGVECQVHSFMFVRVLVCNMFYMHIYWLTSYYIRLYIVLLSSDW